MNEGIVCRRGESYARFEGAQGRVRELFWFYDGANKGPTRLKSRAAGFRPFLLHSARMVEGHMLAGTWSAVIGTQGCRVRGDRSLMNAPAFPQERLSEAHAPRD